MSVLVVGSVAYDSVETPKGKVDKALGGSAIFFSSAASLFTDVNVVGVVGDDYDFSKVEFLKARGVNLDGVTMVPGETFSWKGVYGDDPNERETIYTRLGVFADFKPQIPEKYRNCDYIFLANIDPDLQLNVLSQMNRPKLTALDTMNYWIEGKLDSLLRVLEKVDILFLNDSEIRLLTGLNDVFKAGRRIFEMGPKYVMLKKGEHGSVLMSAEDKFFTAIYPVDEVVDPTGAGDTFAGGFMGYLCREDSVDWDTLKRSVIYGTAAASFAVEDFSVFRLQELSKVDIEERVELIRKMTKF